MFSAVPVNYWAVVLATVASMVVGYFWYGALFGKMWIKEMGWTPESMAAAKTKGMAKQYGLMTLGSLVMAFVLAHAVVFASSYMQVSGLSAGLQAGFWNWLGFIVPVTLSSVLWEGKSWKLWFLNIGYYLVTLLVMGAILAVWL